MLHFALFGSLLFVLVRGLAPTPVPELRIPAQRISALEQQFTRRAGRAPNAEERAGLERMAVEAELWVSEAHALGLVETDPVVQRRLVQIARFVDASLGDDASALEAARELGLDRSDPVVRRRLIERMRGAVRARARAQPVAADELARQYAEQASRYREPERFRISHVFFSRDRHGQALSARAARELERLRAPGLVATDAVGRGDPFVHGQRLGPRSVAGLEARFGPGFAREIATLPVGSWLGPVASAYGAHLVFVEERIPAAQPALSEVETRVREDLLREREREALARAVEALRGGYRVRVEPGA